MKKGNVILTALLILACGGLTQASLIPGTYSTGAAGGTVTPPAAGEDNYLLDVTGDTYPGYYADVYYTLDTALDGTGDLSLSVDLTGTSSTYCGGGYQVALGTAGAYIDIMDMKWEWRNTAGEATFTPYINGVAGTTVSMLNDPQWIGSTKTLNINYDASAGTITAVLGTYDLLGSPMAINLSGLKMVVFSRYMPNDLGAWWLNRGTMTVDNLSITPEPTTIALISCGAVGLLRRRTK